MTRQEIEAGGVFFKLKGSPAVYRLNTQKEVDKEYTPGLFVEHAIVREVTNDRVIFGGLVVGIEMQVSIPLVLLEKVSK